MADEARLEKQSSSFTRTIADYNEGLNSRQVAQRVDAGAVNRQEDSLTPTVGKIIRKNSLTLFNLINLILAVAVVVVGSPKDALFIGIAICNTLMGIIQELRAKRTLDKLSVLSKGEVYVVRDGTQQAIPPDEIVVDDIMLISTGNQVQADGVVVYSKGLEMNESLLTGEGDNIRKEAGDKILSGSYVSAGTAFVRAEQVGENSYASYLTRQAKKEKKRTTPLMKTLNGIVRVLAVAIFPIGGLLFYRQFTADHNISAAVLGSAAGMLGMIPEGLVLLTGVTLTVGALKLARHKALVQTLPSIETLARVDMLCLDKTGTITDGTLSFEKIITMGGYTVGECETAIGEAINAIGDNNATALALGTQFPTEGLWRQGKIVPFSSQRKWSAAFFAGMGSFIIGAPAFVLGQESERHKKLIDSYAEKGQRVLCLARSDSPLGSENLPDNIDCMAFIVLGDNVRKEAADTFRFFAGEGVTLKVISGDDALTVSTIAEKAGIENWDKFVDMSKVGDDADMRAIAENYTVFGRVSPLQKRELIRALEKNGHTCCMTGDGVNDVLAMKEASCSVSMINGSDAARGACDFVLMSNDFSAMTEVLKEGRRVINNIENVASLYLVKTIYSFILSLVYSFIPHEYPFQPLQMTPINSLTVGIPSFFLALRGNYKKPEGKFVANILENSVPAALTVVASILIVQLAGVSFGLSYLETSTMNVLLTGAACFFLLLRVSSPLSVPEKILIGLLAAAFLSAILFFGWFFGYGSILSRNAFFYLPLLYVGPHLQKGLARGVEKIEDFMSGRD